MLHAQAADVREAGRRELIEIAARKEVLMMVPVVFLVLPVTVLFAFWPGVVGPLPDHSLTASRETRYDMHHLTRAGPSALPRADVRRERATSAATCPAGC